MYLSIVTLDRMAFFGDASLAVKGKTIEAAFASEIRHCSDNFEVLSRMVLYHSSSVQKAAVGFIIDKSIPVR